MQTRLTADYIVLADFVLPMDRDLTVIRDGAVAIRDGKVEAVGRAAEIVSAYSAANMIGGSERAVIPGLVNTHTHAAMVYFRGLADDLPLKEWLEDHIWPAEAKWLSTDFVGDAVELACLEMLKAGVTLYNDMYFFGDAAGKATKRLGMRAVLGAGILDFPTAAAKTTDEYFSRAGEFIDAWKGDELITPCIAPHALYTCGPETLKRARRLADERDIPIHIHLAETQWEVSEVLSRYGKTPVRHLDSLGFLDKRVLAAHCVWLDEGEIGILAERGTGVSHCVESNLKLASGIAPVVKMLKAGVKVTFGTDGAASNNNLDVLGDLSTAAKLHKAVSGDPTALDARTALLMATRWAAEAMGLDTVTGSLEPGKAADLVLLDLNRPHLTPVYDIYSHLAYTARASDVETVMVSGRVLVNCGSLRSGEESAILEKARYWAGRIRPK